MAAKTPQTADEATTALTNETSGTTAGKPAVVLENGGEETKTFPKDDAGTEPANIAAATKFDPAGAPVQLVPDVDPTNPAVDANPRANTTVDQNRIDFNDPVKSGQEIVSEQLGMTKPSDAALSARRANRAAHAGRPFHFLEPC